MFGTKASRLTVSVLLVAISACQSSATSIIIDFNKDRIVFVADSRAIDSRKPTPRDDYCKLTVLGGKFIFAATGNTAYLPDDSGDSVPEWHAENDATHAYENTSVHDLQSIGESWARNVANHFKFHYSINPRKVAEDVARQKGGFISGFFAGMNSNGSLAVYQVAIWWENWQPNFFVLPLTLPIQAKISPLLPQIYSPNPTTQELIEGQTERAKKSAAEWQKAAVKIPKATRSVRRLEFLINETGKFDSSVGGPADAVSVSAKGVSWPCNQTCK